MHQLLAIRFAHLCELKGEEWPYPGVEEDEE
jgi:hypothetical protein